MHFFETVGSEDAVPVDLVVLEGIACGVNYLALSLNQMMKRGGGGVSRRSRRRVQYTGK